MNITHDPLADVDVWTIQFISPAGVVSTTKVRFDLKILDKLEAAHGEGAVPEYLTATGNAVKSILTFIVDAHRKRRAR